VVEVPNENTAADAQSLNPYAPPQYVAAASGVIGGMRPHRGTTIFIMGVISMVVAMIFSAAAFLIAVPLGMATVWMARRDLKLMNAGAMDKTGRGPTQAGMVCALVGIAWSLFVLLLTGAVLTFIFGIEYARRAR